ncbi:hypothetical protein IFM89_010872 [Coptis chinensis]|uniref:Retrotransposon Copia-like N-terminal domain-containing protein n=1 Tax=Coptis chinensis TaxID=261450 RepID=A0A835LV81_9MAGN|nr:hypothetical protein IFM89_010872 [Coptis chinensis]
MANTSETTTQITFSDSFGAQITTVKLNGDRNYHMWANVVSVFLTAKKKLKVLSEDPPPTHDAKYEDWQSQNSTVMTWLRNSRGGRGTGRGGRGTGCSFGHGDRTFSYGGRGSSGDCDSWCTHCGRFNHTEEYCWDKWGKPAWANQAVEETGHQAVIDSTSHPLTSNGSSSHVTREEFNQLLCSLQAMTPASSSTHTTTLANSGNLVGLIAHSSSSWVID